MSAPPDPVVLVIAFVTAWLAGAINSIAGGGTLLTFPSLLGLGLESKVANATSTLGLWPGSLGGAWGYRTELARSGRQACLFFLPSLIGGATGALLLLGTEPAVFDRLVPWLILGATLLFAMQGLVSRWLSARQTTDQTGPSPRRWLLVLPLQFLVAVYGGYFGAGIGILMLAALGFLGIEDIHERNGIKNLAALCINGVAVITFIASRLVDWPVALVMAVGALLGGYLGAGIAKRIGPRWVRAVVIAVGLLATAWTAWQQLM